jgi:phosphoglycolate phosphatase-like HAD superfamily hydrolase
MNDIRILNPSHKRGRITHALFDFDGTISLIRHGWEEVMQAVMEEMIAGEPDRLAPAELSRMRREIAGYIDESTGTLCIHQMEWLEQAVKRWGLNERVLSAKEYKAIYNERLLEAKVEARIAGRSEAAGGKDLLLRGAFSFLEALASLEVELILASGTDDVFVQNEAAILGVTGFFGGRIHGALDDTEEFSKENIIRRILQEEPGEWDGSILVVFGDGPVEIRAAKDSGALAVGVASDEERGGGWNSRKADRLTRAGADILIPDFAEGAELLKLIQSN